LVWWGVQRSRVPPSSASPGCERNLGVVDKTVKSIVDKNVDDNGKHLDPQPGTTVAVRAVLIKQEGMRRVDPLVRWVFVCWRSRGKRVQAGAGFRAGERHVVLLL
jgi:hypothetical protein